MEWGKWNVSGSRENMSTLPPLPVDPNLLPLICPTFPCFNLCLIFSRVKTFMSLWVERKCSPKNVPKRWREERPAGLQVHFARALHFKLFVPLLSGVACPHFPGLCRLLSQSGMAALWPLHWRLGFGCSVSELQITIHFLLFQNVIAAFQYQDVFSLLSSLWI